MNVGSESRKETTNRITETLNMAKTKTRTGIWNVRTMYAAGKLAQITSEMQRYKLHILGVSESRWTESGRMTTTSGSTVIYSGRDDNQHHEGVAIIIKKGIERTLLEWKPISSRIIMARFKGKQINITLFQWYAPTNAADEENKDVFYEQLQHKIDKTPNHDIRSSWET
ncbi:craniofacial development protein 2-like [Mytilus edulis]|uniref:craniofacial development protein 2-like n=1 Tax=Mytilus edulis TaxID=6550 RepID=UPI0039F0C4E6